MKKIILSVLVLFVLLVVGVGIAVFVGADRIAREAIQRGGTYGLGVPTTVDHADLSLFSGSLKVDAFKVANPSGFTRTESIASLESIDVQIEPSTVTGNALTVDHIRLEGLVINLELDGTKPNFQPILDHIKTLSSDDPDAEPAPEPEETDPRLYRVKEVTLTDMSIFLRLDQPGGGSGERQIKLPDLQMTDLGGTDGVPMAELTGLMSKAIMQHVMDQAGEFLPAIMAASLQEGLSQLTGLADVAVQQLEGSVTMVTDELESTIAQVNEQTAAAVEELTTQLDENVNQAAQGVTDAIEDATGNLGDGLRDGLNNLGGGLLGGDRE